MNRLSRRKNVELRSRGGIAHHYNLIRRKSSRNSMFAWQNFTEVAVGCVRYVLRASRGFRTDHRTSTIPNSSKYYYQSEGNFRKREASIL
jgi:hypothetical protein